jgi:hypothetical protein
MGLDQYAYVAAKSGAREEFYEAAEFDRTTGEFINKQGLPKPRELAYWRKHPNLQGWMRRLWERRLAAEGKKPTDSEWSDGFNGIELELTWEDLDELERAVEHDQLPETTGFFFGENSDDLYRERDLEFIKQARAELFVGLRVFYNSSW